MTRTHRISVQLSQGARFVRAVNGQDLVLLSAPGTAPATLAIDLAVRLAGIDPDTALWGDLERVLLAGFAIGFDRRPKLIGPCTACAETIEIAPDLPAILADPPDARWQTEHDGWRIRGRLPTAAALELAAHSATPETALRHAMLVSARAPDGRAQPVSRVSPALADAAMARANAAGLLILDVACPVCGARVAMRLDPLHLLRTEAARAGDVAAVSTALSAALGWTLAQVLDLPNGQRRALSRLIPGVTA